MNKSFVLFFFLPLLFFSCSTGSSYTRSQSYNPALEEPIDYEASSSESEDKLLSSADRKILFSANMNLKVENQDTASVQIGKTAEKYHGYTSETGTTTTIIRVKSEFLDSAIADISKLGKVQHKTVHGQDVTKLYMDYQIRLENAEKARARYLELLSKAENVEAALQVEKELERLNETIDLLKGQMNRINHLDKFSTITVYHTERKKPGLLGYFGIGLYHSVKWLFVRN